MRTARLRRGGIIACGFAALLIACVLSTLSVAAFAQGGWTTGTERTAAPPGQATPPSPGVPAKVTLVALLTDDGQRIDQGVVWRIFQEAGPPGSKPRLISTHREASPELRLQPGPYIVNVSFGRAHLTRKITVAAAVATEQFVLNAGGLRLDAVLDKGEPAPPNTVVYDIFSDERDQFGNRTRIMSGARPGLIIRLNAGIYYIVSTYGDANATVRADVTVEVGKLTQVAVAHAAARVTFKLVSRAGGDALADTQWVLQTPQGEVVKESVGALPSHTILPGSYTVIAKSGGQSYKRDFTVQTGDVVQVEVVMR